MPYFIKFVMALLKHEQICKNKLNAKALSIKKNLFIAKNQTLPFYQSIYFTY